MAEKTCAVFAAWDGHAAQGLSPMDVTDALGLSCRLLDMRLVQTENVTLHELISRSRPEAVARELKKSRLPAIAAWSEVPLVQLMSRPLLVPPLVQLMSCPLTIFL